MRRWRPTPADVLTLLRLAAVPVLWVLAYLQMTVALGVGVALAGLTDTIDGPIARRTGRSSRYGGQLDSSADLILIVSIVVWMAWLHPAFFRDNAVVFVIWGLLGSASLLATWLRFGRVGNLHLYSAKAAGVVGYVFAVSLFVLDGYSPIFFGVAIGLAMLAALETFLVAVTRDRIDDGVRSILSRPR